MVDQYKNWLSKKEPIHMEVKYETEDGVKTVMGVKNLQYVVDVNEYLQFAINRHHEHHNWKPYESIKKIYNRMSPQYQNYDNIGTFYDSPEYDEVCQGESLFMLLEILFSDYILYKFIGDHQHHLTYHDFFYEGGNKFTGVEESFKECNSALFKYMKHN